MYTWKSCQVCQNDIIIFSRHNDQHISDIEKVLSTICAAGYRWSWKMSLVHNKTKNFWSYHNASQTWNNGVTNEGPQGHEASTNTDRASLFLDTCNVYQRFVLRCFRIAASLNSLLKKGQPQILPPLDDAPALTFKTLIEAVLSPLILALPRPRLPYSVDTDARDHQLGAALFQTQQVGEIKFLRFWSRTLFSGEKHYSVPEKECLAVLWAQKIHPYLQGEHLTVHSDQASLRGQLEITKTSERQMWWKYRSVNSHWKLYTRREISALKPICSPGSLLKDTQQCHLTKRCPRIQRTQL